MFLFHAMTSCAIQALLIPYLDEAVRRHNLRSVRRTHLRLGYSSALITPTSQDQDIFVGVLTRDIL